MAYLFLLVTMCSSTANSVIGTLFNVKNYKRSQVSKFYTALVSFFAFCFWSIFYVIDFSFDPRVILYSAGYGFCYFVANFGLVNALGSGSVSLTAFVKQLSLVFTSIWGFIFWDTPITFNIIIGILLIAVALYFCLVEGKSKDGNNDHLKISLKWVIFSLMLLGGNAGATIVQKYQQMHFDSKHGTMMMFFGVGFAAIVSLLFAIKDDKTHWKDVLKDSTHFPIFNGLSSFTLNLFLLLLISRTTLSPAVIYPCLAVGALLLTVLFSVFAYKEKLTSRQCIGFTTGAVALIFLNI